MTETSALAQLAEEIKENRELLTTGLAEVTELVYGENGYQYSVYMVTDDGKGEIQWLFKNRPERTYPQPVTGGRWPFYLEVRDDWIVTWWHRSYQEEAIAAQQGIEEAKESSTGLASMTSEDLDALIELPMVLDKNTTALREARGYFGEGERAILNRRQAVINSGWKDDGAEAYKDSIATQQEMLGLCKEDVDTLDEANVKLATAAIDVYDAIAQIYIDDMKEAGDMISTLISLPKSVTSWETWANALKDLMIGAVTRHAEDFQKKVRELGTMVDDERILSKANQINRADDWPYPTGEALSG